MKIKQLCTIGALAFYSLSFGNSITGTMLQDTVHSNVPVVGKRGNPKANLPEAFPDSTHFNLNIPVELLDGGNFSLDIFDNMGCKALSVFAGELHDGYYVFSVNLEALQEGIYYYRLTTADGDITRELRISRCL